MNKELNNWLDNVEGKPENFSNNNIKKERERQGYADFKDKWQANHSISPAPSFTSWKRSYKNL